MSEEKAQRAYDEMIAWTSGLRVNLGFSGNILEALVLKKILTANEAKSIVESAAENALSSSAMTDTQKELVAASFEQVRKLFDR